MEHKGIALGEYQDFLNNMKPEHNLPVPWWKSYRIVKDYHRGFEAQVKYLWWPFWSEIGSNTSSTIDEAEKVILRDIKPIVKLYKHQSRK